MSVGREQHVRSVDVYGTLAKRVVSTAASGTGLGCSETWQACAGLYKPTATSVLARLILIYASILLLSLSGAVPAQAEVQIRKLLLARSETATRLIGDKYSAEKTWEYWRYRKSADSLSNRRPDSYLQHFADTAKEESAGELYSLLIIICVFLAVLLLVALVLALFNRRLQREVQERKLVEEKLVQLADTDSLTQLLNRRAFTQRYNNELVRAQRYGDVFSIILIDLDLFKTINDCYGHDAGDRVLVSVAELLQRDTRESDTCGRFGGEEFIILLPKTSIAEAAVYANRLCQHIRGNRVQLRTGETISISASVGVVEWSSKERAEATIIKADKALYKAKSAGRDQVVIGSAES